ncbi:hypothetical protein ACWA2C_28200 [Priestia megaterium]
MKIIGGIQVKNYIAELKYISNENYELPSSLLEFELSASGIDESIKRAVNRLGSKMLCKDDYEIVDYSDDYAEISFGDSHTGQDVCYTITEI